MCLKLKDEVNAFISEAINGGPLSLISTSGIPCHENMFFNAAMKLAEVVVVSLATLGKQEK